MAETDCDALGTEVELAVGPVVAAAAITGPTAYSLLTAAGTLVGYEVESGVGAHSVAADPATNHIFVPISALDPACPGTNGCIAVYTSVNFENKGRSRAF